MAAQCVELRTMSKPKEYEHGRVMASLNDYDYEGQVRTAGMFLHFGNVRVHVAKDLAEFRAFRKKLEDIEKEFTEHHGLK
jgi:hypothetical protein